jgi:hypothetical protein
MHMSDRAIRPAGRPRDIPGPPVALGVIWAPITGKHRRIGPAQPGLRRRWPGTVLRRNGRAGQHSALRQLASIQPLAVVAPASWLAAY